MGHEFRRYKTPRLFNRAKLGGFSLYKSRIGMDFKKKSCAFFVLEIMMLYDARFRVGISEFSDCRKFQVSLELFNLSKA